MTSATNDINSITAAVKKMHSRFQFVQAADVLDEALSNCGENDWQQKLAIANGFKSIHRVDRSIQIARQIKADATQPDVLAAVNSHLAVYCEMVGEFAQGEEAINQCIDIHPDAIEPQIVLARMLGHQDQHERSLNLLKYILQQYQPRDAKAVVRIFYQLAHSYDAIEMYDNAFEWASKAKAVQQQVPGADQLARNGMRLLKQLLNNASAKHTLGEHSQNNKKQEDAGLPFQPVHLIGFPRSGTTLLGELLRTHPDIDVSSELPILIEQILPKLKPQGISGPSVVEKLEELQKLYCQCHLNSCLNIDGRILIDKKPTNLLFISELLELLPSSKFLVALRDPRDVVISCFLRFFPLTDMSANFLNLGSGCVYYAASMQIWRTLKSLLNENNLLEVRYEELCEKPDLAIEKTLSYLGCDPGQRSSTSNSTGKYIHSPTFAEVRKPVNMNRQGRWRNYQKQLKPYLKILDSFAVELGY